MATTNEKRRQRYAKNKEYRKGRTAANAKWFLNHPVTQYLLTYKTTHPCVDCNEDDLTVLGFDHIPSRGEKLFSLGQAASKGHSLEEVKAEVAKCEVICANCHRRRTTARAEFSIHKL